MLYIISKQFLHKQEGEAGLENSVVTSLVVVDVVLVRQPAVVVANTTEADIVADIVVARAPTVDATTDVQHQLSYTAEAGRQGRDCYQ